MLYQQDRERIVREAAEWLNTPYRGWGRLKHCGCDCLGFIAGVFINVGLISKAEADAAIPSDYSLQIGSHQEDTEYLEGIQKFLVEIPLHEAGPGDVMMFKIAKAYTHSAIVVKYPLILHALSHGGVRFADATKHPLLVGKPVKFFTIR